MLCRPLRALDVVEIELSLVTPHCPFWQEKLESVLGIGASIIWICMPLEIITHYYQ